MPVTLDVFKQESNGERFDAGQVIFTAGDEGAQMYVILEGKVDLRIGPSLVECLGPGEPFGEMALIDHAPRSATAVAATPCVLAAITEKRFLFLVQQHPFFALQIMKVMAARLRDADRRIDAATPAVVAAAMLE